MNIQIFGSSKCFDTKKAERWFKERRIKYQCIDLPRKGFSVGEYRSIRQKLKLEQLVNTKCKAYQDLYMAYITPSSTIPSSSTPPSSATENSLLWASARRYGRHGSDAGGGALLSGVLWVCLRRDGTVRAVSSYDGCG